jgi:transposase
VVSKLLKQEIMAQIEFPQIIERGCGLDVHKDTIVATVKGTSIEETTRSFGTFTSEIEDLAEWLTSLRVTHVAMESTGVYWKPVYYVLEDYFEIILVNARHIKNVPGHKTDKKDSEWIAKLLLSGLLKGSFVPQQHCRELRVLHRHRKKLINQRTAEKNRLQNILEDANIKLASVVSDVFGKSGMAIIQALAQGISDSEYLSSLAKGSLVRKKVQLKAALHGKFTSHHKFMVNLILKSIGHINQAIDEVEKEMDKYLQMMSVEVHYLQTMPGISKIIALAILAEIGTDMSVFHSSKHLASWAGVCPGNNESAGKKKSSRITHGNKYLKTALVEAAWAASRSKESYHAKKFRSIAARRGQKKATMAIAHSLLISAYYILKNKEPFLPFTQDPAIIAKRKEERIKSLEKQLQMLRN